MRLPNPSLLSAASCSLLRGPSRRLHECADVAACRRGSSPCGIKRAERLFLGVRWQACGGGGSAPVGQGGNLLRQPRFTPPQIFMDAMCNVRNVLLLLLRLPFTAAPVATVLSPNPRFRPARVRRCRPPVPSHAAAVVVHPPRPHGCLLACLLARHLPRPLLPPWRPSRQSCSSVIIFRAADLFQTAPCNSLVRAQSAARRAASNGQAAVHTDRRRPARGAAVRMAVGAQ